MQSSTFRVRHRKMLRTREHEPENFSDRSPVIWGKVFDTKLGVNHPMNGSPSSLAGGIAAVAHRVHPRAGSALCVYTISKATVMLMILTKSC